MANALLRDLWFHHADEITLGTITIHPHHVTLHATTTNGYAAWRTRLRRRSKPAPPNVCRFNILILLWPSTTPEL
ncbi:hypothetical protein GCM10009560_10350 [Nonomuraea longicatena]|uniref:Uncharacterized protein n=1 Tax=Nonomuraea longicatena TaxID=83682 RepID=A0ABN1NS63_9ACTN